MSFVIVKDTGNRSFTFYNFEHVKSDMYHYVRSNEGRMRGKQSGAEGKGLDRRYLIAN